MTDAAAPSALARLKIDRSAQATVRRGPALLPWVVAAGISLAAAGAWALYPRTVPVTATSVVQSTPSQQYVQLTAAGYVVAQRRAAVSSKASGRLIELNVREGSQVQKGQLLARLDASDIQATILAAEAAVHQAEANHKQATVQLTNELQLCYSAPVHGNDVNDRKEGWGCVFMRAIDGFPTAFVSAEINDDIMLDVPFTPSHSD